MPGRITRYVFAELLPPTFLGLFLYTFVLMMNHFFLVAEKALTKNLGWDLTFRLFLVGVPEILVLSIPMSVLLGTLIAMGRLSADYEWVALQGAGQGPLRLLRPVVAFGLLSSLFAFGVYGFIVPQSNFAMRGLRGQLLMASNLAADLKPRAFYTEIPGAVLFVDDIRTGTDERRMGGVLLVRQAPADSSGPGATELFLARDGDIYPSPDQPGTLILELHDGLAHFYRDLQPDSYRLFGFDFRQLPLELGTHLQSFLEPPEKVVRDLSMIELTDEVDAARDRLTELQAQLATKPPDGVNRTFVAETRLRTARIELHQRIALPLACLFFAMLALPMGISRVRSGKGAGFALSLAVILAYWAMFTLGRNQASSGTVPVVLGVWAANGLVLIWGIFALWRLHRRSGQHASPIASAAVWIARVVIRIARRLRRQPARGATRIEGEDAVDPIAELGGTPARFVRRLDQYLVVQFLRVLAFALISAYTIYALVELKTLMDGVLRNQQPVSLIGSYLKYFAPGVLNIVLPISVLVAGVVTFALLTRTGELTAIKAAGVSMRRATVPLLLVTTLLCGLLFMVQNNIAPSTNRRAQEIKDRIAGRGPRTYGSPSGRWSFGDDGRTLYHYRLYDPEDRSFTELSVLSLDRSVPRVLDHRFARKARWRDGTWELEDGWHRTFPGKGADGVYERYEQTVEASLPPPDSFVGTDQRLARIGDMAEQMSVAELREEIDDLEARGYDLTRLRVDYHAKWAHPLSPLVMLLLGLPFAFKVGRRGSLYGVGVALLLVLIYWATLATFNALGLETILDPLIAAWTPNILFGLLGTYLMLYVKT